MEFHKSHVNRTFDRERDGNKNSKLIELDSTSKLNLLEEKFKMSLLNFTIKRQLSIINKLIIKFKMWKIVHDIQRVSESWIFKDFTIGNGVKKFRNIDDRVRFVFFCERDLLLKWIGVKDAWTHVFFRYAIKLRVANTVAPSGFIETRYLRTNPLFECYFRFVTNHFFQEFLNDLHFIMIHMYWQLTSIRSSNYTHENSNDKGTIPKIRNF